MSVDPKTHNPAKPASVYTFVDGERLWFGDYK